ncbi:MAG: hypothetical protein M4579_004755 [Chaenotheca gracillima]|nr:MAG: hypothetical protein M4579_004755 [Chaenotheca gracillima]
MVFPKTRRAALKRRVTSTPRSVRGSRIKRSKNLYDDYVPSIPSEYSSSVFSESEHLRAGSAEGERPHPQTEELEGGDRLRDTSSDVEIIKTVDVAKGAEIEEISAVVETQKAEIFELEKTKMDLLKTLVESQQSRITHLEQINRDLASGDTENKRLQAEVDALRIQNSFLEESNRELSKNALGATNRHLPQNSTTLLEGAQANEDIVDRLALWPDETFNQDQIGRLQAFAAPLISNTPLRPHVPEKGTLDFAFSASCLQHFLGSAPLDKSPYPVQYAEIGDRLERDLAPGSPFLLLQGRHQPLLPMAPGKHGAYFGFTSSTTSAFNLENRDLPTFVEESPNAEFTYYGTYQIDRRAIALDVLQVEEDVAGAVKNYWAELAVSLFENRKHTSWMEGLCKEDWPSTDGLTKKHFRGAINKASRKCPRLYLTIITCVGYDWDFYKELREKQTQGKALGFI